MSDGQVILAGGVSRTCKVKPRAFLQESSEAPPAANVEGHSMPQTVPGLLGMLQGADKYSLSLSSAILRVPTAWGHFCRPYPTPEPPQAALTARKPQRPLSHPRSRQSGQQKPHNTKSIVQKYCTDESSRPVHECETHGGFGLTYI